MRVYCNKTVMFFDVIPKLANLRKYASHKQAEYKLSITYRVKLGNESKDKLIALE